MTSLFPDGQMGFDYLDQADKQVLAAVLGRVAYYQNRLSEPAREFLSQVLQELALWRLPPRIIVTAIISTLNSQGLSSSSNIEDAYGEEIQTTLRAFEALDRLPAKYETIEQVRRNYRSNKRRQLFLAAYLDLDLALLCLTNHTVRMRSIKQLPARDARLLAEENETVYLPLIEMLGIWQRRRELGDLGFEVLRPETCAKIKQQQSYVLERHRQVYEQVREVLGRDMVDARIKVDVRLHESAASSIDYRRATHGVTIKELIDQIRIDVTVATVEECYHVQRLLQNQKSTVSEGKFTVTTFTDLVLQPKFNGYRAFVTDATISGLGGSEDKYSIRFHICTREMETVNDYGVIAARYLTRLPIVVKEAWWEDKELIEFVRAKTDAGDVEEIFVFSPVGQVSILPAGSTPIDYAYRVHSDIGNHCKNIWVDDRPALYDQELHDGDCVRVEADMNYPGPSEKWLSSVKTSTARIHISRALSQQKPTPPRGRQIFQKVLARELRAYRLRDIPIEVVEKYLERTASYFNYSDVFAMYVDMAGPPRPRRLPSPDKIVSRLIANQLAGYIVRANGDAVGLPEERIEFAQCSHDKKPCRVVPGSRIVGRRTQPGTKYEGLLVYRQACPNAPKGSEAVALEWRQDRDPSEAVHVIVEAVDRAQLLRTILESVYDLYDKGLYLREAKASITADLTAEIELKLTSPSRETLELLQEKLDRLKADGVLFHAAIDPISPVEKALLARRQSLPNPYTSLPVRDARLFKGREVEIERIVSSLKSSRDLLIVYGGSRVGKTSLLGYMHDHVLTTSDLVPALVNIGLGNSDESGFWHAVADGVNEALVRLMKRTRRPFEFSQVGGYSFREFLIKLDKVHARLDGRKLVILIDEFTALDNDTLWHSEQAQRVVYQMKSLVEAGGNTAFVLCIHENMYKDTTNRLPSWPLVRSGVPVPLGYLDRPSAERLIREPLGGQILYEDDAVEHMLTLTACHPYYLQLMLYETLTYINGKTHGTVSSADVHGVIPRLLDAGELIFLDFLQHDKGLNTLMLAALAHVSSTGKGEVSVYEIYDMVKKRGASVELTELVRSAEYLYDRGVLARDEGRDGVSYSIRVPLFEHWLARNRPVNVLLP